MSENCTHDCSSCGESCPSRTADPKDFLEPPHQDSNIKKVIGIVSGKGGVGKSLVTGLLAVLAKRQGLQSAVLDGDITGPSIPKMFGVHQKATGSETAIYPVESAGGIPLMSINLLLDNETDPVIWRGPILANTVKQFWTDVAWGDVDVLFIDMPPGTGDVPLTVFQSIPLDGLVIVASPQELVSMIVAKAVNMASDMNIPILGLVENMSYIECPDCGKKIEVFGKSSIDETAAGYGLPVLAKLPIVPEIAALCDAGRIEDAKADWLDNAVKTIAAL